MGRLAARLDPNAAAVFQTADHVLGLPLSTLVFDGPADALQPTPIQQPAILTTSVAYLVALRSRGLLPEPAYVAGHSLGEYAALVAVGALGFEDALRLVRRRGELMQEHGAGGMAALLGMESGAVEVLAAETGVEIANFNAPGQVTVSGRQEAIERVVGLARERGAKRAIPLPVSAAFHSALMAPVAAAMRPLIDATAVAPAAVPLVTNVAAEPIREPDALRRELIEQICASVRWVDVVERLAATGVRAYYEVGPGKVLAGLIARIAAGAEITTADALLAGLDEEEKVDG